MADETNIDIIETPPPAEVAAAPKKRRGPRPKTAQTEAVSETPPASAAPARGRRKRADKDEKAAALVTTKGRAKKAGQSVGKTRAAKPKLEAQTPGLADISDLLQLEEENARLRKALAEKLRAENADLRKRLGLA